MFTRKRRTLNDPSYVFPMAVEIFSSLDGVVNCDTSFSRLRLGGCTDTEVVVIHWSALQLCGGQHGKPRLGG